MAEAILRAGWGSGDGDGDGSVGVDIDGGRSRRWRGTREQWKWHAGQKEQAVAMFLCHAMQMGEEMWFYYVDSAMWN